MESNSAPLPSIFKFSVIWNILPYFGYLHEWKQTLESLCLKTRQIWRENYRAFCKWGSKHKSVIKLTFCEINNEYLELQDTELYSFLLELFKYDYEKDTNILAENFEEIAKIIFPLLFTINDNLVVLLKNNSVDNCYREVNFLGLSEIPEILPSVLWPSCKSETKRFNIFKSFSWVEYILEQAKYKSVVVKKVDKETFEVFPTINSEVRI